MRVLTSAVLSILAVSLAGASCSRDSYLLLTLTGDKPFDNVNLVRVVVRSLAGTQMNTLNYGTLGMADAGFDMTATKTLSIGFTPSQSGLVKLDVCVYSNNVCLGSGAPMTNPSINKGDVTRVSVQLVRGASCAVCSPPVDGGTTNDAGGVTFPGCDPGTAGSCSGNQTCFVNCSTKKGECLAAGTRGPGETCTTNNDCVPGTQCFTYSCGTQICLKFCNGDGQCASPIAGGGGAGGGGGGAAGSGGGGAGAGGSSGSAGNGNLGGRGGGGAGGAVGGRGGGGAGGSGGAAGGSVSPLTPSACKDPVACSATVLTTYKTCSFACDPRGDGTKGCPAGLFCFLYRDPSGQDSPDCGCKATTRVGTDGVPCPSEADCAPGFVCNMMGGTQSCRKLCDLNAPTDCTAPQTCRTLLNNKFGVCI